MEKYTKYEKARIIGARATQISMGAPFLVKISKEELVELKYDPIAIAKKEFEAGVIPIRVVRPLPRKGKELEEEAEEPKKEVTA